MPVTSQPCCLLAQRVFTWAVVALLLLANPGTVRGASPESVSDARCFIAAISLMQSPNNTVRAAAASSALYYLGRLDGREPQLDLENLILDQFNKLTPLQLDSVTRECAQTLSARGRVVVDIGKKLSR
jgi:hypothetical protein